MRIDTGIRTVIPFVVCLTAIGCSRHAPATPAAATAAAAAATAATATFNGLGDLAGGDVRSEALAISDDGRVVVGRSSSAHSSEEGFVWTKASGLRPLLGAGGAHIGGEPRAVSAGGSIIGGKIVSGGNLAAARWTQGTGWVELDDLEGGGTGSQVLAMSGNGEVLVGWGTSANGLESARWTGSKVTNLGDLPGGRVGSAAAAVSADGAAVAGTGTTAQGPELYLWKAETGMVALGELAGGQFGSEPFGMSPSGGTIVGKSESAHGTEAFRWMKAGGMQGLGDLSGGDFTSIAFDVSDDGTIVGTGTGNDGAVAVVWDAKNGIRAMKDVLLAAGAADVQRWQLTEATGISGDGRTVIGNGTNPQGALEGWVARLPVRAR
jgi:uncharacterized membrane protein